ncbi:hypothetical protein ACIHCM_36960 [Streptomyces sp. NPDC052023]
MGNGLVAGREKPDKAVVAELTASVPAIDDVVAGVDDTEGG